MVTKKKYSVEFMNYGIITVPKGTKVTNQTACGIDANYHFVSCFKWVDDNYKNIANILKHDLTYSGLNIPKNFINKL